MASFAAATYREKMIKETKKSIKGKRRDEEEIEKKWKKGYF